MPGVPGGCRAVFETKQNTAMNKPNITPLHDRVLIKRVEKETKSSGGIVLPDTVGEKPMEGTVIATGPGKADEKGNIRPLVVQKGDRVLFSRYGGTEIKIDGEAYLIVREDDLLAIIK